MMPLLFNMLSRFVIVFLPRSKCLLISWLQSLSAMILEPKKIKSVLFPFLHHLFAMKYGAECQQSVFWMLSCKPAFSLPSFTFIRRLFSSSLLSAIGGGCLVAKSCPTLMTVACQVPLSLGFSRQEHWSGLPCPSPGDLPNPGIKPESPALQADSLPIELQGEAPNSFVPDHVWNTFFPC